MYLVRFTATGSPKIKQVPTGGRHYNIVALSTHMNDIKCLIRKGECYRRATKTLDPFPLGEDQTALGILRRLVGSRAIIFLFYYVEKEARERHLRELTQSSCNEAENRCMRATSWSRMWEMVDTVYNLDFYMNNDPNVLHDFDIDLFAEELNEY